MDCLNLVRCSITITVVFKNQLFNHSTVINTVQASSRPVLLQKGLES